MPRLDTASAGNEVGGHRILRGGPHLCYHDVRVAVQKKFGKGDAKEIGRSLFFVEEIADYFRLKRINS